MPGPCWAVGTGHPIGDLGLGGPVFSKGSGVTLAGRRATGSAAAVKDMAVNPDLN